MRIVIFGPPGSGKGTQAGAIADAYGIPAISTGSMFRAMVESGSELGQTVASYIDKGEFVPDRVVSDVVRHRLTQPDTQPGFLLDGYPRTVRQVEKLDAFLAETGDSLDVAIKLSVPNELLIERMLGRAATEGRKDDNADVIAHRLDVYTEQTAPLEELYDQRGILLKVDGVGTVDEVAQRIKDALATVKEA